MRKGLGGLLCVLLLLSITIISWKPADANKSNSLKASDAAKELLAKYIDNIYQSAHLEESGLDFLVFKKALTGFLNLKASNKLPQNSAILSVVDLAKSSCSKRMWIIDVINKELILNTLASHGQGSGDDIPTSFSDNIDSRQSSLCFYITDKVYFGKNGRSLHLDGLDAGFNTNARARAIVLHGADYVSQGTIDVLGRLGRSYGCPAVPLEDLDMVIETVKNKTAMFINGNDDRYYSKYLDEDLAANFVQSDLENSMLANL
jgi:hypothetical protein